MSELLQQMQQGAAEVKTSLDVSTMGGNRKTPPGNWKARITDACAHPNKEGTGVNMSLTVEIMEGPSVGSSISDMGPYPDLDPTDDNYFKRAFKARQVVASILSAIGGKEKVQEIKEKGVVGLELKFRGEEKYRGKTYTIQNMVGKDVYVKTEMKPSTKDPRREFSKVAEFITKEVYESAPGRAMDTSFTQPGNTATVAPVINETVESDVNLAPKNGASPANAASDALGL